MTNMFEAGDSTIKHQGYDEVFAASRGAYRVVLEDHQ